MMDELIHWLRTQEIRFRHDVPLAEVTTFKLGGACPVLIECHHAHEVLQLLRHLNAIDMDFILIGGGSNLVISDGGVDVPVVRFLSSVATVVQDGNTLTVAAASSLDELALYCAESGLAGMVNCSGIPGTVGGAIAGNAGAFGWQVGDCIKTLTLCKRSGETYACEPSEMEFSYRDSRLKRTGEILLDVTFELTADDPRKLLETRNEILTLRREKHPDLDVDCCAGSFFRNLAATSKAERRQAAGHFLEQVDAKSMRIGGAGVFPKHANIIVKADETCTAQDVYDLHLKMKRAVQERFGFELIPEVRFVGEFA